MFKKAVLLFLLSACSYAEIRLVAVTHASCPACQAWHKEIADNYPLKDQGDSLPSLTIYDVSNPDDLAWVHSHISGINGLPTFALMDGNSVKTTFAGYYGVSAFYTELKSRYSRYTISPRSTASVKVP